MTAVSDRAPLRTPDRSLKDYAGISLRGIAMGAADVVPGVSGGTIAIIAGIYEELIDSIKSIGPASVKRLFTEGVASFWQAINGTFLLALVAGIAVSIFSLAKLITHALDAQPILVWSFFFGLVVASVIFVARRIAEWSLGKLIALVLGVGVSYLITVVSPAEPNTAYWFVFASGAIAICAMILPGISGSFILVLLGMYKYVLGAVSELKIAVLLTFMGGAAVGLIGFSNLLSWLLRKYHDLTIAALVGVMIGSLNKVWPWKQVLVWQLDRHGKTVPVLEANVLPHSYAQLPAADLLGGSSDPHTLMAVALALCGFVVIVAFELLTGPKAVRA
jgi:putative membrane protein